MIDVDKVWSNDITYLQIGDKNYYLCVVLDWASREVLGWRLSDNMNSKLCLYALAMALSTGRKPERKYSTRIREANTPHVNGSENWKIAE